MLGTFDKTETDLRKDALADFISSKHNSSFSIYRLKKKAQVSETKIRQYINRINSLNVKFDYFFSLKSKDTLYCTEMIAQCYSYASDGKIEFGSSRIPRDQLPFIPFFLNEPEFELIPIDFVQLSKKLKKIFYHTY